MFEPASRLPCDGEAAALPTATYDEYAAQVIRSVADLDAQDQALARETHLKLQDIYTLHLMGLRNPTRHAAFLRQRGVIFNKRTSPELATVKAVYPRERWKQRSPTMTQWKTVLMALAHCGVHPAEVPQWLRNPVDDGTGKEVCGFEKARAVLKDLKLKRSPAHPDPKEQFDALVMERRKEPIAILKAAGYLANISGPALALIDADRGEVRVLRVFTDPDFVRKAGLKGWPR
jgi:hypothetical protein